MNSNRERLDFIRKLPLNYPPANLFGYRPNLGTHVVMGGDGFGYEWDEEQQVWVKFPHGGDIYIGKNVSIGSCSCIDRASLPNRCTVIGDGTKIDNLVHIAHNAIIGKNCLIVAGAVIGGSAVIGDRCYIGMGALIKNKVIIGNDVTVGMGAVVIRDVPDGWTVIGNPAKRLEK